MQMEIASRRKRHYTCWFARGVAEAEACFGDVLAPTRRCCTLPKAFSALFRLLPSFNASRADRAASRSLKFEPACRALCRIRIKHLTARKSCGRQILVHCLKERYELHYVSCFATRLLPFFTYKQSMSTKDTDLHIQTGANRKHQAVRIRSRLIKDARRQLDPSSRYISDRRLDMYKLPINAMPLEENHYHTGTCFRDGSQSFGNEQRFSCSALRDCVTRMFELQQEPQMQAPHSSAS